MINTDLSLLTREELLIQLNTLRDHFEQKLQEFKTEIMKDLSVNYISRQEHLAIIHNFQTQIELLKSNIIHTTTTPNDSPFHDPINKEKNIIRKSEPRTNINSTWPPPLELNPSINLNNKWTIQSDPNPPQKRSPQPPQQSQHSPRQDHSRWVVDEDSVPDSAKMASLHKNNLNLTLNPNIPHHPTLNPNLYPNLNPTKSLPNRRLTSSNPKITSFEFFFWVIINLLWN